MLIRRVLVMLALCAACSSKSAGPGAAKPSARAPATNGFGPWTFAMTRAQVEAVTAHAPYTPVRVTGGLETANGSFEGEKKNISFIFGDSGTIRRIQIWMYEGKDVDAAVAAWAHVFRYMKQNHGGVLIPEIEGDMAAMTEPELTAIFRDTLGKLEASVAKTERPEGVEVEAKFRMDPKNPPTDKTVSAALHYQSKYGYYVFLYVDPPTR